MSPGRRKLSRRLRMGNAKGRGRQFEGSEFPAVSAGIRAVRDSAKEGSVLRPVFTVMAAFVLAAPVLADDGGYVNAGPLMLGDRDAYEEDYSDEFDKATKEQYKAKRGEKERLTEKEWSWYRPIEDRDPFWAGPVQHESGDHFHHLNTTWPMEAAATLDPWRFYIKLSLNSFKERFDDTDRGEDVYFNATHNLGIIEGRIGFPLRIEIGLKYIYGENLERGHNDTFWFEGRSQIIYDDERDDGSKAMEIYLKWNLWKHKDGVSGFGFNLKYKEPLAIRSNFLDTMAREGGINLIGSIKWGITSYHLNIGYIYTRSTRLLFHSVPDSATDTDPDHAELDSFFTGGFAMTIQVWEFIMLIAQVEGHTNAWDDELEETYNSKFIGSGLLGLRTRLGPLVIEGGLGRRFNEEAAAITGVLSVAIKF
ncbi:MAG: hypothetical protein HYY18_15085 [Planctomycetes bacterium]|nr:hypothetical protein [Planctomycetota bacterium]